METSSSSGSEEDVEIAPRKLPVFRPRVNWASTLNDRQFVERFCLTPGQAEKLLEIIGPDLMPVIATNHALNPKQKLLCALRFFATNSPYWNTGDSEHISKATTYRCVRVVRDSLIKRIKNIQWPDSMENCRKIALNFYEFSKGPEGNLPGFVCCVGAIDGTYVPITAPSDNEYQYVNRKKVHSLNVMGIAGPDLKFYSISTKFPGSVNDARVFRCSGFFRKWNEGFRPFPGSVVIGDAIYPKLDFLIPMRNFGGEWLLFYEALARCRVKIEMAWAMWKNRFPCLRSALRLKDPTDSALLAKALAILHNFLIDNKEEEDFPNEIPAEQENEGNVEEEIEENEDVPNDRLEILITAFKEANGIY